MMKDTPTFEKDDAFWLKHPDPTQASVHLALQWLAFVYPASELQIDGTLKSALPYADTNLSKRWAQFLESNEVEQHVEALKWISQNLSAEQVPFLVETCWRLLLVDHELPTHVPLALRIMGQVLDINENKMYRIGEEVFRECSEGFEGTPKAPLLPVDPRYLDRVEWRLYGHSSTHRSIYRNGEQKTRDHRSLIGFVTGACFGALLVLALVFGPLQLGRITVSRIMPEGEMTNFSATTPVAEPSAASLMPDSPTPNEETTSTLAKNEPVASTESTADVVKESTAEVATEALVENETTNQPSEPINLNDDAANEGLPEPVVAEVESNVVVAETSSQVEQTQAEVVETVQAASAVDARVLMEVTASILNVRTTPQTNGEIAIKLAKGARVWAYPESSEGLWMFVRVQGESGYVSARFLKEVP